MTKKCIHIIEDEPDILMLYKEFLAGAGFDVTTATNGEEGLTKIQEKKYDLILMDVMMPKVDGLGVLQTLKDAGKKIPTIVMLSNLSHDEAVKEALALGAKDYVIKSEVNPDQLLEKIKKYLD